MEVKTTDKSVYRVIKCPLKGIFLNTDISEIVLPIIEATVKEINKFSILAHQFLKLYLLEKFNCNDFPTISEQFLLDLIKVAGGVKLNLERKNCSNKDSKIDLKTFYDEKLK